MPVDVSTVGLIINEITTRVCNENESEWCSALIKFTNIYWPTVICVLNLMQLSNMYQYKFYILALEYLYLSYSTA